MYSIFAIRKIGQSFAILGHSNKTIQNSKVVQDEWPYWSNIISSSA